MNMMLIKKYIRLSDGGLVLSLSEKMKMEGAHSYLVGFDAQVNNEIKNRKQSEQEIMFDLYKLIQNFREVMCSDYSLSLFLKTIDNANNDISEATKKFIKQKMFRDLDGSIKYFINLRKRR